MTARDDIPAAPGTLGCIALMLATFGLAIVGWWALWELAYALTRWALK